MTDSATLQNTRKQAWTPPQRPDWVARINEEGSYLDLRGVVPLDAASLIGSAMANTGLSDFGSDDWREPFAELVRAFDDEAQLNLMGRLMTRSDMLMFLEGRLRVEEAYRRHPEIEEQEIVKPLWILGQGRSGTSALQNLLSLDPGNRPAPAWEALFPGPWDGDGADRRRDMADARIRMWNRVTPEIAAIHDFHGDAPTETIHFECLSFQTPAWLNLLGLTPGYNRYMAARSTVPSFAYARRVFKLLQWQRPGGPWVLKSPNSINYLPDLMEVFPDARFIWSHRDPISAMSSAVSLIGTLSWIRSDQQHSAGTYEEITDPVTVAASMARPIDWIEAGIVPRDQLCNIQYPDLVRDPVGTIGRIYAFHDIPYTAAAQHAIADHVARHPRTERPKHRYSYGTDAEIAAERAAFKRYQDYFGVANEI